MTKHYIVKRYLPSSLEEGLNKAHEEELCPLFITDDGQEYTVVFVKKLGYTKEIQKIKGR